MPLVFSDLDGCLLGSDYGFEPARPALRALREAGVPLVLCTSKTRAELAPLAASLGLCSPAVVENGGAVVAADSGATLLALGTPRGLLLEALPQIGRELGLPLRGFAQMTASEVSGRTGLPAGQATLALVREWDEPFVVEGSAVRDPALDERLQAAARRRGLRVSHGGRLHHLHGPSDKGDGVRAVLRLLQADRAGTVALGDAASDLPMLLAVERPIVMPRGDGRLDPALASAVPDAERAPAPGPAGWNTAVLRVLGCTGPRGAAP